MNNYETDNMVFDEPTYLKVADFLLNKHFGISVSDTGIEEQAYSNILDGIRPYEAVNQTAEKYDLVRTDIPGPYGVPVFKPLTADNESVAERSVR